MLIPDSFSKVVLQNRLGQQVELAVYHTQASGREYVFVAVASQQASSLVAKNAEHFAFQLRDFFSIDARRMELIEMRGEHSNYQFVRWRFEWVGNSPLSPRSEVVSPSHELILRGILHLTDEPRVISA